MTKQLIIKEGNYSIHRVEPAIKGGNYVVCNHKERKAKAGLSLDAAFDIFRKLTLKEVLRDNNFLTLP